VSGGQGSAAEVVQVSFAVRWDFTVGQLISKQARGNLENSV